MKFYQQQGSSLVRTHLHQSDNICECCQGFDHGAQEYHHDDAECPRCHSLCCCGCHRPSRRQRDDPGS